MIRRFKLVDCPEKKNEIFLCSMYLQTFFDYEPHISERPAYFVVDTVRPRGGNFFEVRKSRRGDTLGMYDEGKFQWRNPGTKKWNRVPWIIPSALETMKWDRLKPLGKPVYVWIEQQ